MPAAPLPLTASYDGMGTFTIQFDSALRAGPQPIEEWSAELEREPVALDNAFAGGVWITIATGFPPPAGGAGSITYDGNTLIGDNGLPVAPFSLALS